MDGVIMKRFAGTRVLHMGIDCPAMQRIRTPRMPHARLLSQTFPDQQAIHEIPFSHRHHR